MSAKAMIESDRKKLDEIMRDIHIEQHNADLARRACDIAYKYIIKAKHQAEHLKRLQSQREIVVSLDDLREVLGTEDALDVIKGIMQKDEPRDDEPREYSITLEWQRGGVVDNFN